MELRSLSKNLAREKYLKAKNEERKHLQNHHFQHHYEHGRLHKIKYTTHKKGGKKESEINEKCIFF